MVDGGACPLTRSSQRRSSSKTGRAFSSRSGLRAGLACDLLDAIDALDPRQTFGCQAAAPRHLPNFERLVELAVRMCETADVHTVTSLCS